MDDETLKDLLFAIDPRGREVLRKLMRADQWERDAFAETLMRLDAPSSKDLATLIDSATLYPEMRRSVGRFLAELEAAPPA
jgi:hypothetical protein